MAWRRRHHEVAPPAPGVAVRMRGTSGAVCDDPTDAELGTWLDRVSAGTEEFLILERVSRGNTFIQAAPELDDATTYLVEHRDAPSDQQFILRHLGPLDTTSLLADWVADRNDWATTHPWELEDLS